MPLEAILEYPGLKTVITASIPRHHGTTPDLITIEIAPQANKPARTGTLRLAYANQVILLPECVVDQTFFSFDERGELWSLKMWDYRWKWRFDQNLVGRYNIRLPDGPVERLDPLTEKPIRELMVKCLEKMRIPKGYKILGEVPKLFPSVYWNYANPSRELQTLCDLIGFRIVAQFDGQVWLLPESKGDDGKSVAKLPNNLPTEFDQVSINPPERPDKMIFVCGSSRYQFTLPLESVADDIDGLVVPQDDVSYKPDGGWREMDMRDFINVPLVAGGDLSKWYNLPSPRELAKGSVFRKYRIRVTDESGKPLVFGGDYLRKGERSFSRLIYIPGCPVIVKDVRQILPIGQELLEPVKTGDGWYKQIPFIIWGQFANGVKNNFADDLNFDTIPKMIVQARDPVNGRILTDVTSTVLQPESFSVDPETGIVTIVGPSGPLGDRMYRYTRDSDNNVVIEPARLWIRGTCQVMEYGSWVPVREEISQDVPSSAGPSLNCGSDYIQDRELFLRVVPQYNDDKISLKKIDTNKDTLKKEAKARLDSEIKKLQELKPAAAKTIGWWKLNLNGGIQEICYTLGETGAFTMLGLHNEYFVQTQTYEQRRFLEKAADERTDPKKKAVLDMIREKDMPFSRASGVTRSSR